MGTVDELREKADSIKYLRDRLRVQVNLAGKEVRDEWEEVEEKWDRFRANVEAIKDEADDLGDDAVAAASKLGKEVREAYDRIKQRLG